MRADSLIQATWLTNTSPIMHFIYYNNMMDSCKLLHEAGFVVSNTTRGVYVYKSRLGILEGMEQNINGIQISSTVYYCGTPVIDVNKLLYR